VLREDRDDVVVLTLNRPQKRNALSRRLIAALSDALETVAGSPRGRAVVLTASGATFCSGMDLKEAAELLAMPEPAAGAASVADMQAFADLLDQIHTFPRPVVAAVQGDALAGGAGIALSCDFVVMASTALLGYPEVKRGIVASVVMHDLVRLVGDRRARQLLLTGEPIDATQAQAWGLVNHVAAPDHCFHRAMQIAEHLTQCAPQALATTKQLLDDANDRPASLRPAAAVSAALRGGDEAREGIRAFVEKRHAHWQLSPGHLPTYRP
jgi:methylglutaconyl-CoA hydratase